MPRFLRHLLLILLPVVGAFAILPAIYSNNLLLFNFMIFMTLAQGINVIYGFTGYLPFGYVGFFGAGAYGFSLMVIHLHAPPLLALSAAASPRPIPNATADMRWTSMPVAIASSRWSMTARVR